MRRALAMTGGRCPRPRRRAIRGTKRIAFAAALVVTVFLSLVVGVYVAGAFPTEVTLSKSGSNPGGYGGLYGHGSAVEAYECAPTGEAGPFSTGHYPPASCEEIGRKKQPGGDIFYATGNEYCVAAGKVDSGATFVWVVNPPATGYWSVEAYIPNWTQYGWDDQYVSTSADGTETHNNVIQQAYFGSWVQLFPPHHYSSSSAYDVELTDTNQGAETHHYCHYQTADKMRWRYDSEPAPAIGSITPNTGAEAGGEFVNITGKNFTGVESIVFGSKRSGTFKVNSETSITAQVPAGKGTVEVAVIEPNGTSGPTTADHFTYGSSGNQAQPIGGEITAAEVRGGGTFCFPCIAQQLLHGDVGQPVDTENGNMFDTTTDFAIPARGFSLLFARTYNADAASTNGPLGYGWVDSLGASIKATEGGAVVTEENGAQVTFAKKGTEYVPPPRDLATLVHNTDSTWTLIRHAKEILTFNSAGQITAVSDLNGEGLTYSYTEGRVSAIKDSADRELTLAYSGSHLVRVTDPNVTPARVVEFVYDEAGDLTDVIDVGGGHTQYAYDGAHRMLTMKSPKCLTTPECAGLRNTYDSEGRVVAQTDALNRVTTFRYEGEPNSASGGATTVTSPAGNTTVYTYQYGVKISETDGAGTPQGATTKYSYNAATLEPELITDPRGNSTTMTYDAQGNLLTTTDPLKRKTTYTYNNLDEPLTIEDPTGVTETLTYDSRGNITSRSRPLTRGGEPPEAQTTTYVYGDPADPGDLTEEIQPEGGVWKYGYDAYGDRDSATNPLGDKATSEFNADSRLMSSVSPRGNAPGENPASFATTYAYNAFGQLTESDDPLGHKTLEGYDADKNLEYSVDPDGRKTSFIYDSADEQTEIHRADKSALKTTYTPDGEVREQIDGASHTASYAYDPLDRVSIFTDPLKRVTRYGYDPAGDVTTIVDPEGNTTATTYDADYEPTAITYSAAVTPSVTGIEYNADGERTAMTDGSGDWTWQWDSLGRRTEVSEGGSGTVKYGYDLRNDLTAITYPGFAKKHTPEKVTRTYNAAGQLTAVSDWLKHTTTFTYNPDGDFTSESMPKRTVEDTFAYDDADQLASILDKAKRKKATLFAANYGRDPDGQVLLDSSASTARMNYSYTPLNQVCYAGATSAQPCGTAPSGSAAFTYDAADNLTQNEATTQAFNAGDELCWTAPTTSSDECAAPPTGATQYAYNERGDRTQETPAAGEPTTLDYDQANRLSLFTHGATMASYTYNGDGLRMAKTVGETTSSFVWDVSGSLPLMLSDGANSYIYGPNGVPLEQVTGKTARWLHQDGLGSTRLITSSKGKAEATYRYTLYGKIESKTGTANTPMLFAGEYRDSESGFYYSIARYYDPLTGQFLSRDPAATATRSPYGYVGDNPTNAIDPSGRWSLNQIIAEILVVVGVGIKVFGGVHAPGNTPPSGLGGGGKPAEAPISQPMKPKGPQTKGGENGVPPKKSEGQPDSAIDLGTSNACIGNAGGIGGPGTVILDVSPPGVPGGTGDVLGGGTHVGGSGGAGDVLGGGTYVGGLGGAGDVLGGGTYGGGLGGAGHVQGGGTGLGGFEPPIIEPPTVYYTS